MISENTVLRSEAPNRLLQPDSNSLPDVNTAEHSKDYPEEESHGHSEQCSQQAVKDEFDQLKGGVASNPHSVEAVRGNGLRDDIFKTHLLDQTGQPIKKNH